ncbi:MAG: hypothetical protein KA158_10560, partial [Leucobacter sp.]|nr:hypothetical protein [Leucobacter sp.]
VALSAASLGPVCRRYVFVSTVTAFEAWPTAPVNESSRLLAFVPAARSYGASKAECERELESALGDRLTVIYPGIMIGPRENVGRLPWWLARHARGGPVIHSLEDSAIAPIDARDVAEFVVRLGEQATRGMVAATRFIVAGARGRATFGEFLGYCQEVTGGSASPIEVPADILLEHGVEPWTELPLWAPTGHGADAVWATDSSAAVRAGLTFRSLRETIADTWEWMRGIGAATDTARLPAFKAGIGLDATKEQQVIAAAQQKLIGWRDTRTQSGTA